MVLGCMFENSRSGELLSCLRFLYGFGTVAFMLLEVLLWFGCLTLDWVHAFMVDCDRESSQRCYFLVLLLGYVSGAGAGPTARMQLVARSGAGAL